MVWLHITIIKLYQVFDWNWPKGVAVAFLRFSGLRSAAILFIGTEPFYLVW